MYKNKQYTTQGDLGMSKDPVMKNLSEQEREIIILRRKIFIKKRLEAITGTTNVKTSTSRKKKTGDTQECIITS